MFLSVGRAVSRARVCLWSPRRSPDPDRPAGPSRPCLTRARAPPSVALQATTVSLATRPRRGAEHRVRVCRTGAACPRAAPHGAAAQRAGGTPRGPTTRDARGGAPAAAAAAAASCSQTQKTRRARTGSARLARAAPRANRPEREEKSTASYNPSEGRTNLGRKNRTKRNHPTDIRARLRGEGGAKGGEDGLSVIGGSDPRWPPTIQREGGGGGHDGLHWGEKTDPTGSCSQSARRGATHLRRASPPSPSAPHYIMLS